MLRTGLDDDNLYVAAVPVEACLVQPLQQAVQELKVVLTVMFVHTHLRFFSYLFVVINLLLLLEKTDNVDSYIGHNTNLSGLAVGAYVQMLCQKAHVSVMEHVSRQDILSCTFNLLNC